MVCQDLVLLAEDAGERLSNVLVFVRYHDGPALDDGQICPERAEEVRELSSDVAPAHDCHGFRQRFESQCFFAGEKGYVLDSIDGRNKGPRSRCNDHFLSFDGLIAHFECPRAEESSACLEQCAFLVSADGFFDLSRVFINNAVDTVHHFFEIHAIAFGVDPEQWRIIDGINHVRAMDEHLGRDASAIEARASHRAFFNDRDLEALISGSCAYG